MGTGLKIGYGVGGNREREPPGYHQALASRKLEQDVVLGFGPTRPVRTDDLHDVVEQRGSLSAPSCGELSLDTWHVGGMACLSDPLEPPDCLAVT